MQDNLRTVNVGLIGLGTVGGGVARTILSHHDRYLDAYNIDLKGFDQSVYDVTGGKLETVKNTIERANENAHVEVTTLVIPGVNDDMEKLDEEATWLASVNPDIPLHLTRFFPQYRYADRPATPLETLHEAQEVTSRHLNDVLLGNV